MAYIEEVEDSSTTKSAPKLKTMNHNELAEQFAQEIIDGMDQDGLIDYAVAQLAKHYSSLSQGELISLVEESADYLLD